MLEKIKETAAYIHKIIGETPDYAVVLGSGLGALQKEVEVIKTIDYHEIPNFPLTTVVGHTGKLIYGMLEGKKILMMSGRFHYYEGYPMEKVTFPIRVFGMLGIKNLILSNASGGVNPDFKIGDIMLVTDHINLMPEHPLRGANLADLGPRFVDMSEAYNRKMLQTAREVAKEAGINVKEGVYVGLQGPTFETPAEYGMVRVIGGDAVGMSTVPEVIVAKHMNLDCFCVSVITDVGGAHIAPEVSHEEVLQAADKAMPGVVKLVRGLIRHHLA